MLRPLAVALRAAASARTVAIVAVVFGVTGLCRVQDVRAASDSAICAKVISDNEIAKSPDSVIEACSRLIALRSISPLASMGLLSGAKILAVAYLNRCGARSHQAKFDDALSDCNEAISLNPEFAVSYNNRGLIWFRLGDFERAIEDFNAAIKLNPALVVALSNRCVAYLNKPDLTCDAWDLPNLDYIVRATIVA